MKAPSEAGALVQEGQGFGDWRACHVLLCLPSTDRNGRVSSPFSSVSPLKPGSLEELYKGLGTSYSGAVLVHHFKETITSHQLIPGSKFRDEPKGPTS